MSSRRGADASQGSPPLRPTYFGHIGTTADAIILFEACLSGQSSHVPRRPHDRERADLIRSGCVYIYEEHSSGIKRWTDGITWSPSRIMNNFLVYRELDTPFPPGEKKRAAKKPKKANAITKTEPGGESSLNGTYSSHALQHAVGEMDQAESTRMVYGSLIDSYDFKKGGLVKKTISINYRGVPHHLVSYYTAEDLLAHRLVPPVADPALRYITPRTELLISQNFRCPVEIGQLNLAGPGYSNQHPPPYNGGWEGHSSIHHNPQTIYSQSSWRSMSVPDHSYGTSGTGFPYVSTQQQLPQQQQQQQLSEQAAPHDGQQAYSHEYHQQVVPQAVTWGHPQGHNGYIIDLRAGVSGSVDSEPLRRHSTAFPALQSQFHPDMSYGGPASVGGARLSSQHAFADSDFLTAPSSRMPIQQDEAPASPRTVPRAQDGGHTPNQFTLDETADPLRMMNIPQPFLETSDQSHGQHDQYDTGLDSQNEIHGFTPWAGTHQDGL